MRRIIIGLILLILLGGVITVLVHPLGTLSVDGAWVRPAVAGENSAAYFAVKNNQIQGDTLVSVACDAAEVSEVHTTIIDETGKAAMRQQGLLVIPPNQTVTFTPGGLHVMMTQLKQDLKPGEAVDLKLNFQNAGTIEVKAIVQQP